MNIFAVHQDPVVAAQSLCDKHVVKMVLETAQLLCAHYPQGHAPYKRTHYNHPCARWARESKSNYEWLIQHGLALGTEYSHRYGKEHKSVLVISWCQRQDWQLDATQATPFVQAMPIEYQVPGDSVSAYRNYYKEGKKHLLKYTKRQPPEWLSNQMDDLLCMTI
jgi:hypothetical protein